jgi:DNA processing protein
VISGGAYGIDAAAHQGALEAGGQTTVVFGGGLDLPYPDRHLRLFERIAGEGRGALISPFSPGTPPVRGGFLARNALIAALSQAVVVVEAGWRSGAHNTASHASQLGLPVLAVPGSPGTERLLAQGARPLWNADGLSEALAGPFGPDDSAAPGSPSHRDSPNGAPSLPESESVLWSALAELGRARAEQVAEHTGQPSAAVLGGLTSLVMQGLVIQEPGGWYRALQAGGSSPRLHLTSFVG